MSSLVLQVWAVPIEDTAALGKQRLVGYQPLARLFQFAAAASHSSLGLILRRSTWSKWRTLGGVAAAN